MTLSLAQALYEKHKALTYPRTDSRYLPEDHVATAKQVMGDLDDPAIRPHAQKALAAGWVRPNKRIFNDAKVSDHFAIVPTGTIPKGLTEPGPLMRNVSWPIVTCSMPPPPVLMATAARSRCSGVHALKSRPD